MNKNELTPYQLQNFSSINEWVLDTFGKCRDFESFRSEFNKHFIPFQKDSQKKLDISSIIEGKISCSVAAIIVSIWWRMINPKVNPHFLITRESKESTPYSWLHVVVAFPTITLLADNLATELDKYKNNQPSNLHLVDYSYVKADKRGYLRQTPPEAVTFNYKLIDNIVEYYIERCVTFNFQTESNSLPGTKND